MRLIRVMLAALSAAAIAATTSAAAPLAAYGKLPSIEEAAVSPSGKAIAVVFTNGEDRTIVVQDLDSHAVRLRGFLGANKVRSVTWAGDDHLAVSYSATFNSFLVQNGFREWLFGSTIDLKTKKMSPMLGNAEKADLQSIFGYPLVRNYRGEPAVFVQGVVFSGGSGQLSLFRIDLATGASRLVETGSPKTIDWVVDSEGRTLAQALYESGAGIWTLKLRSETGWREVASITERIDRPYLVGLGRDNRSVIYAVHDADGRWRWREARLDPAGATEPATVADGEAPIRAALDGRMIGRYALVGDEDRYTFFDPADARAWQAIVDAFPGRRVSLESWSADRKKIVVLVDSKTEGPAFALVDMVERNADWLGSAYADLKPADISPREPIRFKAADGLPLSGYLTLPQGRPAKGLPLVVFAHGGPASRDKPGFDWWAQAMASRGYAVLQVNFRGSAGLGEKLLEAGYGEWGRKMQTDLSDGVRYLAAQGVIDPKRVCIVGASYGGYAALAGATMDHGVYRCAAAVAGVADLRRLVGYSRSLGDANGERYWNRFMGYDSKDSGVLARNSPIQHAAEADAPILLVHGKDDTVVPLEQSRIMAEALQRAGKPVDLIVQPGADHWLSRGDTRLQMLDAVVAFLEKHNPPH
ncbi:MAG: alpha/beta hydrolase family protein [Phenylobacterium sp.]